ncbi:MAG: 6-phosphogluconolactonase [Rhodocyclaceae bacterium]|nr:6-phosphogluconolactonase [Rhodocyclaceae bacterium]
MSTEQIRRWHSQSDGKGLARVVSAEILHLADIALADRGVFHLVLAGGSSPRVIYETLREADADWPVWHIWFGDERCLAPDDAARNSRMAAECWLDHVDIPAEHVHIIPTEQGAKVAAAAYANLLAGVGDFDLVLLGLGEDGHTASLFPNHAWGAEPDAPEVLAVFDSPKPPSERVSLSARRLSAARQVFFITGVSGKESALSAWRKGESIPAAAITPASGVDIFTIHDA